MLGKFGTLAGALAAGWFGFFVVSNVDMGDVVAYNNIQKRVGSEPFRAGDIVAISPDGASPRLVCSMEAAGTDKLDVPLAKLYVNGLGAALPEFAALVDWVGGLAGRKAEAGGLKARPAEVRFIGKISSFPMKRAMPAIPADCICAVAESLLRRSQLCTVERSLIETALARGADGSRMVSQRTVGVTYRSANIFIADFAQLDCPGLQGTANFQMEQQTGLCSGGEERTYDVALRETLGLIRETDLPDD